MSKSDPLERAFRLIEIVASAGREMSLSEIVEVSRLPQSSAFRICGNLVESGMLAANPVNKTYSVGSRALRLSHFLRGRATLEEAIGPLLQSIALRFEETSFFVQKGQGRNSLLRYVVPEVGARSFIHPGFEFPAHATAAGKLIFAFGREGWEDALREPLERYQDATITDPSRLAAIFEAVRRQGFSENEGELDAGVYSACAPIFLKKSLIGAIGVVAPASRISAEMKGVRGTIPRTLVVEARQLSDLLSI
jgi:DNA-binding IclR family transcriptional regulator